MPDNIVCVCVCVYLSFPYSTLLHGENSKSCTKNKFICWLYWLMLQLLTTISTTCVCMAFLPCISNLRTIRPFSEPGQWKTLLQIVLFTSRFWSQRTSSTSNLQVSTTVKSSILAVTWAESTNSKRYFFVLFAWNYCYLIRSGCKTNPNDTC